MAVKRFIVEIDVDKHFNINTLEHAIIDKLNKDEYKWIELHVDNFDPDDYK